MNDYAFQAQFGPEELALLHELAEVAEPVQLSELDSPAARGRLREAEVLVTSWGCPRLDADRLADAPHLRAVLHAAGTVRKIVSEELWARGVRVTNAADENAVPVAEFTLAAIIFAGKKAPFLAADARMIRGDRSARTRRGELSNHGRTIGVVGYSRIGRRVVELLRVLDVHTLLYDPFVDPTVAAAAGAESVGLDELLRRSDVVTIHAPELPATHHMIGADQLALMRDGATLINTARGSLVDTAALTDECAAGRLDAILDVTDPEPLPPTSVLYDLPNVMLTPHVAGSLGTETRRMSARALEELRRYAAGEPAGEPVTDEQLRVGA
jgi:phosphoglycerate dehydrogenase-like enzyme